MLLKETAGKCVWLPAVRKSVKKKKRDLAIDLWRSKRDLLILAYRRQREEGCWASISHNNIEPHRVVFVTTTTPAPPHPPPPSVSASSPSSTLPSPCGLVGVSFFFFFSEISCARRWKDSRGREMRRVAYRCCASKMKGVDSVCVWVSLIKTDSTTPPLINVFSYLKGIDSDKDRLYYASSY